MSRKEYSKQTPESFEQISAWLSECAQRYDKIVSQLQMGTEYDMPYAKALKIAIHNLRLHLRGVEEVVEELKSPMAKIAENIDKHGTPVGKPGKLPQQKESNKKKAEGKKHGTA